jgi:hypothetical protein
MLLTEHSAGATDRHRRYSLRALLVFDPIHDIFILGLTLLPFCILWILDIRQNSTEAVRLTNAAKRNIRMHDMIFNDASYSATSNDSLATVFPLYPLLLSLPRYLSFGHFTIGIRLFCLFLSAISNLLFLRLCLTLRFITNPFLTACLFTIYPLRSLFLKHIANEYSLFLILLCGLLLGKQIHDKRLFSFSLFLLNLTNELGIWISIGLLGQQMVRRSRVEIRNVSIPFAAALLVLAAFHKCYLGSFFPYLLSIFENCQFPFKNVLTESDDVTQLRHFHANYGYFMVAFVAAAILVGIDARIGIPMTIALLWATSVPGTRMYDAGALLEGIVCLLGFDVLIQNARFQMALVVLAPLYFGVAIRLTSLLLGNQAQY